MLNEKILLDNFYATGNDFDKLRNIIEELKEVTEFRKCTSSDIAILSYLGQSKETGRMYFCKNDIDTIDFVQDYILEQLKLSGIDLEDSDFEESHSRFEISRKKIINSMKIEDVYKNGGFDELINELKNTKFMIADSLGRLNFVSDNFLATAERFGLKGNFLATPNVNRDSAIERQFVDDFKCTLVLKRYKNITKAFSLLSGKYQPIDQKVLFNIINALSKDESLGKPVCRKWEVTNFMTSVYIEFPKKADELQSFYGLSEKFVPGLWLATSDTGHCSLKVRGTWRHKDSITFDKEILKKHLGEIDIAKIVKEVENTIFAEYNKLPERLCELMMQDIADPSWDLSTAGGQAKYFEKIKGIVKNVFEEIDMLKAIGLRNRNSLFKQFTEEFDLTVNYTAYDLATGILNFPERVEVAAKDNFMKACGVSPYANYEVKKEEELLLL